MSNKSGNVSKSSTYLAVLTTRVELDRGHPLHHGIRMQAHHIVSAKGVQVSGMGNSLVKHGYDINSLKNLVFLPSTLQGACHLGVQPHRGDHSVASEPASTSRFPGGNDESTYDDDAHPNSYHELIAMRLRDLKTQIEKECDGKPTSAAVAQRVVDELSREVALLIYGKPSRARLTRIADSFLLGHSTGCSGADSVGTHKSTLKCPVSRNHRLTQGGSQRNENIGFEADKQYMPRPGK